MSTTESKLEYLAPVSANPIGVDPASRKISGVIVAKAGAFLSGRGEFDQTSHRQTVALINAAPKGIKSRMGHPDPNHPGSAAEVLGFLGRFTNARIDGDAVRADLQLDQTAFLAPPNGGTSHGDYLLSRAKSDPDSLATSMVVAPDKVQRLDTHAKPKRDDDGNVLPPLWRPQAIHAVDFVDEGDSTGEGMLAVAGSVCDDELLRLRQRQRRRKMLVSEPTAAELRLGWHNLKLSLAVDDAGDKPGFIPAGPPHGAGSALPGSFKAPTLSDFAMRSWSALSEADRRKIAGWYGWCSSLDSFSGGLHLPYRFATGSHRGRASLAGVRAALARLDQTAAVPAANRDEVRTFLESFLPGGFRRTR